MLADAAGAPLKVIFGYFGDHSVLLAQSTRWLVRRPFRLRLFIEQMESVGVKSLPIIMLVGFFSGAVAAQQAIAALEIFNQERYVGATVGLSLAQELAPVFTALMITASAGSAMATELGSMRITEQIDALTTFAVNPVQYLITPRIVATVLMMPIMTMVFNIVGLFGAYLYSIYLKNIDLGQFIEMYTYWTDPKDYIIGATKAAVFGVALSLAACYQGFNLRGGAKEVGEATRRAVVSGSVAVLVLDYFLIDIFHILWPYKT
jgi:phospholipid/cholesterol/gamma-HCH transport system permease protein